MSHKSSEINRFNESDLKDFLSSFFYLSDKALVIAGKSGNILKTNPFFLQLAGYAESNLSEKLIGELLLASESDLKSILSGNCNTKRSYLKTANGHVIKVNVRSVCVHDQGVLLQLEKITNDLDYESELKKTINKFTTLIDNSRDVLYSVDFSTLEFEYLSSSVIELTGYSRNELLRMKPLQIIRIIHADYRPKYLKYLKTLRKNSNQPDHTIEYKIKTKIGISRWFSDNHKVLTDENGKAVKLVGNIRDITEFKLVEEALNRSRDRLFKAIEATNDGMWDWKLKNDKIYFDSRFYTMLGYQPLEFAPVMSEWTKRIHEEDVARVKESLMEHLHGKTDQWLNEYRFLAKDGSWVWILNKGKVFERDQNGNPLRMVGTHSDISLRKKAEEELQKRNIELQRIYAQLQISEEKFRQLAENTDDVFWLSDEERLIYINPAFDKMWGRDRNQLFSDHSVFKQWIHPDDVAIFDTSLSFKILHRNNYLFDKYRIIKPDGEVRWLWSRMFPVYDDQQRVIRIAGITTDITDQKKAEEALIMAKEKAMESDQLKSAFLANISHEIRTPMNGIIGFAELLKDDHLPVENRVQYVNVITKSSVQLLQIIDDIIDISKIEANQLKICRNTFKISSLLEDLLILFEKEKVQMGKGKIKILTESDPSLPDLLIYSDESRMRQIFMNLISNALKFTEKGYVKFGYTCRQDDIEFFVEDTGIGIPPEQQSVIFKRFRQLDYTLTRRYGGTGLGLAICEGLVKLMDGKMFVRSEQGKGSRFYFTVSTGEKTAIATSTKKEPFIRENFNWQGRTILIVEDDETNQQFLEAVLTPTKAVIITAATGEDAVSFCKTNDQIDLVLMDIRLPSLNGFEAFEKIRKINSKVPVIAQTAFAMSEDENRCIEKGFCDFISKPINRKHLLSVINMRLNGKKS